MSIKEHLSLHTRKTLILTWVLIFFIFAAAGFVWEVLLDLLNGRGLINAGVLFGPWLPIYGFGGVLMCALSEELKPHPVYVFLLSALIATTLELFTSYFLEASLHARFWDYHDFPINFEGRICLLASCFFGIGGCLSVYKVVPPLESRLARVPTPIKTRICSCLASLFLLDFFITFFIAH